MASAYAVVNILYISITVNWRNSYQTKLVHIQKIYDPYAGILSQSFLGTDDGKFVRTVPQQKVA